MCEDKIRFACATCGKRLSAPTECAGRQGTCPRCQAEFVVPGSPDDDDEPRDGEPTVRCWDCGRRVREKSAVRRNVTTGRWSSSGGWSGSGGWTPGFGRYNESGSSSTSGTSTGRVDLCRRCVRRRDEADAGSPFLMAIGLGLFIAAAAALVFIIYTLIFHAHWTPAP
jgi:hypothetical protein